MTISEMIKDNKSQDEIIDAVLVEESTKSAKEIANEIATEQKKIEVKDALAQKATEEKLANEQKEVQAKFEARVEAKVEEKIQEATKSIKLQHPIIAKETTWKKEMNDYLRAQFKNDHEKVNNIQNEWKALVGTTSSSGEHFVPEDFSNEVMALAKENSMIWDRARKLNISSDTITLPSSNNMAFTVKAQGAALDVSEVTTSGASVTLIKHGCVSAVSNELMADTNIDITAFLTREFGTALNLTICDAVAVSDGTSGSVTSITSTSGIGSVVQADVSAANKLSHNDLRKLQASIPAPYQRNGVFTMNSQTFYNLVLGMVDSTGQPVIKEGAGEFTLFGRPVDLNDSILSNITVGETDNTSTILYGDPSQLTIVQKGGLTMASSQDYNFNEDEMTFRAIYRFNTALVLPTTYAKLTSVV